MRIKGYILAAVAAMLYGTNPAFAVPLYRLGMNAISVILFRYALGVPLLAFCVWWLGEGFGLQRKQLMAVGGMGLLMGFSSLTLYEAYNYMNPGVASTLLFMYPLLTSLIMSLFFHEKFRLIIALSLVTMAIGLYLLTVTNHGVALDIAGMALISLSSLSYAVYLVLFKVLITVKLVPTIKSLFYQLLAGGCMFLAIALASGDLIAPHGAIAWIDVCSLALFPTALSLLCAMKAINYIGPTPTAIFGALEPVTAVALSVAILGEEISGREILGGCLIILSTMLVVCFPQKT